MRRLVQLELFRNNNTAPVKNVVFCLETPHAKVVDGCVFVWKTSYSGECYKLAIISCLSCYKPMLLEKTFFFGESNLMQMLLFFFWSNFLFYYCIKWVIVIFQTIQDHTGPYQFSDFRLYTLFSQLLEICCNQCTMIQQKSLRWDFRIRVRMWFSLKV